MNLTSHIIHAGPSPFYKRLGRADWLYALALMAGALFSLQRYSQHMDYYEQAILISTAAVWSWMGWQWKSVQWLTGVVAVLALSAIYLYGGLLPMADTRFFLNYMLSSQSAILWMSALFFLSTMFYWVGLIARSETGSAIGSTLCWGAVVLGATGMLVRWYESYLLGVDISHIPVSNLYEVFVLFCLITALFYLYYDEGTARAVSRLVGIDRTAGYDLRFPGG